MIDGKIVWFLKEPRSGSTWLTRVLLKTLPRNNIVRIENIFTTEYAGSYSALMADFKNIEHRFTDTDTLYATHRFEILSCLDPKSKPIIIRSIRENIFEQILSELTVDLTGWRFTHRYLDAKFDDPAEKFFNKFFDEPVTIPKAQLVKYIKKIEHRQECWQNYHNEFETYTIKYEQLEEGVRLPFMDSIIKFDLYDEPIIKTPDYKKTIFANYDEIKVWIEELKSKSLLS